MPISNHLNQVIITPNQTTISSKHALINTNNYTQINSSYSLITFALTLINPTTQVPIKPIQALNISLV